MRVALTFPGCHRRGGVERVMLECANFLQSRGHETHVYASDWTEPDLHRGVVRHRVPASRLPSFWRPVSFARRSTRLVHESHPGANVLGAFGVLSPPGGVVWVQSVHKTWLEISRRERRPHQRIKQILNPFHPVILALEQSYFGGRRYRKLIALTEQVKADLKRLYDVPEQDIVIIPNGFSPAEFNVGTRIANRARMRQSLGYKEGDQVIIFVANELERKGFGPLLHAIASLREPRVRLLAVGRLSPDAYKARIDQLGLAERVRFAGPSGNVADYYAAADLFALPTQYEAWGLVIVEAMACGLPVLTSRLAGAAVAVQEGMSGELLDDPRDVGEIGTRLRVLLDGRHGDPERISRSVARFAWTSVLPQYERILAENASGHA